MDLVNPLKRRAIKWLGFLVVDLAQIKPLFRSRLKAKYQPYN